MVALSKALSTVTPRPILVVGDLILDRYIFGHTSRISPEAPVPVVVATHDESKAGGAGNVALNLLSMGARPRLLSRVGDDAAGHELSGLLVNEGVDISGVFFEVGFATPVKTRVIASSQQLLRIDREQEAVLLKSSEERMIKALPQLFADIDLVAISDYAKGTLSDKLLQAIIQFARKKGIPCITDPKGTNFKKYSGSTILKPNASETLRAASVHGPCTLEEAAAKILQEIQVDVLAVTRSEEGISLFYPDGRHERFPVVAKEVRDVTGAGDTVLAMLSLAYASGVCLEEAIRLSNVAATCAVERIGCTRVSLHDVASLLIEQNPSGKVCSSEAFFGLLRAMPKEPLLMVRMPLAPSISSQHLMRMSEVTSRYSGRRVVAYFQENSLDPRLLDLVASLGQTHLVVHGLNSQNVEQIGAGDHVFVDLGQ